MRTLLSWEINLNALADEYLRLSYHGLRAKDNTFNAGLVTDFAPDLEKVAIFMKATYHETYLTYNKL
ncbi:hypothetical protein [Rufibacter sp. XAAS-G3-1]|uniref:hypothetical protein n=1 Tax=Rufibacter sp. XAAS-G3-1 TaxID=2729134 RepID=UPI0015E7C636|nr:hypothetical protein [Rufibacter sp. XAAS-G3-1]